MFKNILLVIVALVLFLTLSIGHREYEVELEIAYVGSKSFSKSKTHLKKIDLIHINSTRDGRTLLLRQDIKQWVHAVSFNPLVLEYHKTEEFVFDELGYEYRFHNELAASSVRVVSTTTLQKPVNGLKSIENVLTVVPQDDKTYFHQSAVYHYERYTWFFLDGIILDRLEEAVMDSLNKDMEQIRFISEK